MVSANEEKLATRFGLPMTNTAAFDVPPPGVGLKTVTLAKPAAVTSEARIAAVTCVGETKVVPRT